jgi:hypothetical protein
MPKSKEILESDDDLSSNDEKPKKKQVQKRKASESEDEENQGSDEEVKEKKPAAKNGKTAKPPAKKAAAAAAAAAADEDDQRPANGMYELAKMRFVNVSEFKGKAYVNIREYYEANGKTMPGKKGISLSIDQWENLKKHIANIDKDLKKF